MVLGGNVLQEQSDGKMQEMLHVLRAEYNDNEIVFGYNLLLVGYTVCSLGWLGVQPLLLPV